MASVLRKGYESWGTCKVGKTIQKKKGSSKGKRKEWGGRQPEVATADARIEFRKGFRRKKLTMLEKR